MLRQAREVLLVVGNQFCIMIDPRIVLCSSTTVMSTSLLHLLEALLDLTFLWDECPRCFYL